MRCKKPIITKNTGGVPIPCSQCLNCRIDERRIKTHRMMLEASQHDDCSFLTLTYNDENLPSEFSSKKTGQIYDKYSVNPKHVKNFINNLQVSFKRKYGKKIKYFTCGEYGEKTNRPHYHIALFGYPTCLHPNKPKVVNRKFNPCTCRNCAYLQKLWGKGHIYLGTLTQDSAQYVAGYVTKKLTSDNSDFQKSALNGRHPEFARMSLKPALGKTAIEKHALHNKRHIKKIDDIPKFLVHNGKKWPLGKYLREIYKKTLNLEKTPWTFETRAQWKANDLREKHDKMLSMFNAKTLTPEHKDLIKKGLPLYALELLNSQRSLQIEKQHKYKLQNKGI